MKQIEDLADNRNKERCVYCGGSDDTRDHVPSRVLLDEPYPDNLPTVPACVNCNASFAQDEEYLACFIECAITGSIEAASKRRKIAKILQHSPGLLACLTAARTKTNRGILWSPETTRVRNVIMKLARGHVAFEESELQLDEPRDVVFVPVTAMTDAQRREFEAPPIHSWSLDGWPEVGSRAMTRVVGGQDVAHNGWIEVQPEYYRYRVRPEGGHRVQMILREYLTGEVAWDQAVADVTP